MLARLIFIAVTGCAFIVAAHGLVSLLTGGR